MRELDQRFPELVVVGVHSGKFSAERVTANLRDAVVRLGVDHPVVNDRHYRIWRSYAVGAWPTLVLVDARGYVVGQHAGEITADTLAPAIGRVLEEARAAGALATSPLRFPVEPRPSTPLCFPQKLALDAGGTRLAVADTGHDRVLVARLEGGEGRVELAFGGGDAGLADGPAQAARFRAPHGLAFEPGAERLYVADTGNHAIRELDLARGLVRTVAGTGEQARSRVLPGAAGAAALLNSPWDVLWRDGVLYVAMAGGHQLWQMNPATGAAAPWIGSGAEALHDGGPRGAALAQPSGLTTDGRRLYFADSESSAIRAADFDSGETATIVGTGLFDFGDRDGAGEEVRLQHPLGVAWDGAGLLVADTYNDAVKRVDPLARTARRLTGEGLLREPGGIAAAGGRVLVADSGRHRVVALDTASGAVTEMPLRDA